MFSRYRSTGQDRLLRASPLKEHFAPGAPQLKPLSFSLASSTETNPTGFESISEFSAAASPHLQKKTHENKPTGVFFSVGSSSMGSTHSASDEAAAV